MASSQGSLVLLKVGDGGSPESFTTLGGLKLTRLQLLNRILPADALNSGVWRTLLNGVGPRSLSLDVSGQFTNQAAEEQVRVSAFEGSLRNYRVMLGNGYYFSGPFLVASYVRTGNHDELETYALSLESAGLITYGT